MLDQVLEHAHSVTLATKLELEEFANHWQPVQLESITTQLLLLVKVAAVLARLALEQLTIVLHAL